MYIRENVAVFERINLAHNTFEDLSCFFMTHAFKKKKSFAKTKCYEVYLIY